MSSYLFYPARYLWRAGTGFVSGNMFTHELNPESDGAVLSVPELVCTPTEHSLTMDTRAANCGINPQILGADIDAFPVMRVRFRLSGMDVPEDICIHWCCDRFEFDITASPAAVGNGEYELTADLAKGADGRRLAEPTDDVTKAEIFFFGTTERSDVPRDAKLYISYIALFDNADNARDGDTLLCENADMVASYDDGVAVDWARLDSAEKDDLLAKAEAKKREIINAPDFDIDFITGTAYYISSEHGDDENDGLSPESAWRTLERAGRRTEDGKASTFLRPGDAVLLERGSRFDCHIPTRYGGYIGLLAFSGVTYAAYGEGPKPIITNEIAFDGVLGGAGRWKASEWDNVWELEHEFTYPEGTNSGYCDVGNIVFDDGEKELWGIKICPNDPENPYEPGKKSVYSGIVTNGVDVFPSGGEEFTSPGCMSHNLEFLHDWPAGKLYVYYDRGNPGECFKEIKAAQRGYLFYTHPVCGEGHDISAYNIAAKHCSTYGIDLGVENILLQGCEIGWIGGGIHFGTVRYGQGFEWYGRMDGFTMRDCWIYHTYDAAVTIQSSPGNDREHPVVMNDMKFIDNVMEYNGSLVEIWCGYRLDQLDEYGHSLNKLSNVVVKGNYMLYAGYGYNHQRSHKRTGFIVGSYCEFENCVIHDNVMMFGQRNIWDISPVWTNENRRGIRSVRNFYAFSTKYNNLYYHYENFNRHTLTLNKHRRIEIPYEERAAHYAVKIGAETDPVYRWYDEPLFPEEALGVYH